MSDREKIERREFLKMAGLMGIAGLSMPSPRIVGRNEDHEFLVSNEQYGGFLVRQSSVENPAQQSGCLQMACQNVEMLHLLETERF